MKKKKVISYQELLNPLYLGECCGESLPLSFLTRLGNIAKKKKEEKGSSVGNLQWSQ